MKMKRIKLIFLIILIIGSLLPIYSFADDKNNVVEYVVQENEDIFSDISAPNLLLAETNSGRILYEKNIDEKIYPASITKLMTAILVVENCDLDEIVIVSENAVISVPSGYVNANLQVGEELTVEDLLYAMLIPSANDAANALAEHVGGSIESFATMMNTRAKELGCTGSNFNNPSGLHEENHYTTTRDLYLISQKVISDDTIKKIIGTTKYTLPKTNKYDKTDRTFTTTNYMKRRELSKYYYQYCIGAKTGYTGDAKNCVVAFAQKDGIELTAIVMGEDAKIKGQKFLDAKEMFEYVFNNYENKQMAVKNERRETIKINNGTKETKTLDVLYKESVNILIPKDMNDKYVMVTEQKRIEITPENNEEDTKSISENIEYYKVKAPIQKGEIIGKVTYQYDGADYQTDLIAGETVEESKVLQKTLYVLLIPLIIFIIYNYKKSNNKYGKTGKKSNKRKAKRIYY